MGYSKKVLRKSTELQRKRALGEGLGAGLRELGTALAMKGVGEQVGLNPFQTWAVGPGGTTNLLYQQRAQQAAGDIARERNDAMLQRAEQDRAARMMGRMYDWKQRAAQGQAGREAAARNNLISNLRSLGTGLSGDLRSYLNNRANIQSREGIAERADEQRLLRQREKIAADQGTSATAFDRASPETLAAMARQLGGGISAQQIAEMANTPEGWEMLQREVLMRGRPTKAGKVENPLDRAIELEKAKAALESSGELTMGIRFILAGGDPEMEQALAKELEERGSSGVIAWIDRELAGLTGGAGAALSGGGEAAPTGSGASGLQTEIDELAAEVEAMEAQQRGE